MLAEQLKVSLSTIKKHLKRFKDLGLIERIGPDKGGHWKVKNNIRLSLAGSNIVIDCKFSKYSITYG